MENFIGSLESPGLVVGFLYRNEMGLLYWGLCLHVVPGLARAL